MSVRFSLGVIWIGPAQKAGVAVAARAWFGGFRPEMVEWLDAMLPGRWRIEARLDDNLGWSDDGGDNCWGYTQAWLCFNDESDAVHCKLRWSDELCWIAANSLVLG